MMTDKSPLSPVNRPLYHFSCVPLPVPPLTCQSAIKMQSIGGRPKNQENPLPFSFGESVLVGPTALMVFRLGAACRRASRLCFGGGQGNPQSGGGAGLA